MGADAEETLVIRRRLVYLWRGQLPQGRGKGSSLANPACNKQYNTTLLQQTPLFTQFGKLLYREFFLQNAKQKSNLVVKLVILRHMQYICVTQGTGDLRVKG